MDTRDVKTKKLFTDQLSTLYFLNNHQDGTSNVDLIIIIKIQIKWLRRDVLTKY